MASFEPRPTTATAIAALQPHLPEGTLLLWAGRPQPSPLLMPLMGFALLFGVVVLLLGIGFFWAGIQQQFYLFSLMSLLPMAIGVLLLWFIQRHYRGLTATLYGASKDQLYVYSPLLYRWWELSDLPKLEAKLSPLGTFTLGYSQMKEQRRHWTTLFWNAEGDQQTVEALQHLQKTANL